MGAGVAQDLAQHGHRVVLVDVSDEVLERARGEIRQNLRLSSLLGARPAKPRPPADEVLSRIELTTDYDAFAEVDFLVENVVERWEVKRRVYPRLDAVCPAECVLAANTSCLSITRLAGCTGRPDRVIGMHFMNPVPLKPVVEVIRGFHTSDATVEAGHRFLAEMGKEGIVVQDLPGFVSNRVLMLMINEAAWLVQDQVAAPEDVDRLFTSCFGHKMGPLATGDMIGLDTILDSLLVLYDSYADGKFRPCPLLRKMVDAGLHGRKSGRGFFDYRTSAAEGRISTMGWSP
jgi:3-hydroxybutyryl-CoA dehydrogenase